MRLKKENLNSIEALNSKEKYINEIHLQWKNKEEHYIRKIEELQMKFENTLLFNKELMEKCEKMEKEMFEIVILIININF